MKCFSIVVLCLYCSQVAAATEVRSMKAMDSLHFAPDSAILKGGTIQFYYELLQPSHSPVKLVGSLDVLRALDTHHVLASSESGKYYLQLTKIAYRVKRSLSYFSSKRTCDESYMKRLYEGIDLAEVGPCQFKIGSVFPAPGLTMDIAWFNNLSQQNSSSQGIDSSLLRLDSNAIPSVSIFEYGHDFSRIMGQKTVLSTAALLNYYPQGEGETLVVNYTMSFIYNIPPRVFGGADALKSKFLEQIGPLVDRTESLNDD